MKKAFLLLLLAALQFAWSSCQQEQTISPEEVIKTYQNHIDNNEFEKAKQFATPNLQIIINSISEIFQDDSNTVMHTSFLSINCTTTTSTASCLCTLKDDFETFKTNFTLIKTNDQWLIDAAEQIGEQNSEEIEIIEEKIKK